MIIFKITYGIFTVAAILVMYGEGISLLTEDDPFNLSPQPKWLPALLFGLVMGVLWPLLIAYVLIKGLLSD